MGLASFSLSDWPSLFDPPLLVLALLVCAAGSFTVFTSLDRASVATGRSRSLWLAAVCVCFGANLEATYFVALLAYVPVLPFSYEIKAILGSFLAAAAGCAIPFSLLLAPWPGKRVSALLTGAGLGLTIACTHWICLHDLRGVGRAGAPVAFDLPGFGLAVMGSWLAADVLRARRWYTPVIAGLCLAVAIFGEFFFALRLLHPWLPRVVGALDQQLLDSLVNTESVALVVAGISGAILMVAFYAALTDRRISALKVREANKRHDQMCHDPTTGLPNRLGLHERMREMALDARTGSLAVVVVDLDRFKLVNEFFGRQAGDDVLREAGERLQALVSPEDIVGRVGGDKFVILYHMAVPEDVTGFAEEVVRALDQPFLVEDQSLPVGASIGVATALPAGESVETLLQDADLALHYARAAGGGQFRLFESGMRREQAERHAFERDFRRAIEAREFIVYYQPLFDSDKLTLCGFEALVRWQHPVRGLISPAEFIPFAEQTGLITTLGLFVMETACTAAAGWPDGLRIAINISPVQLRIGDLVGAVSATLAKTGLPARRLELEMTEGALIENPEQARLILSRLKAAGVRIAIDDFGTGYSSLSYLRQFPFDRIKIDRSFIKNLEADSDALLIVRAIIDLGHSLGAGVLAEGVETTRQLQLLRNQNCDVLQGFLLGKPLPIGAVGALVANHVRAAAQAFADARQRKPRQETEFAAETIKPSP